MAQNKILGGIGSLYFIRKQMFGKDKISMEVCWRTGWYVLAYAILAHTVVLKKHTVSICTRAAEKRYALQNG